MHQAALTQLLFNGSFWGLKWLYTTGRVELRRSKFSCYKISPEIFHLHWSIFRRTTAQTAESYSPAKWNNISGRCLQSPVPMHLFSIQDERILCSQFSTMKNGWDMAWKIFKIQRCLAEKSGASAEQRQLMRQKLWKRHCDWARKKGGPGAISWSCAVSTKDGSQRNCPAFPYTIIGDKCRFWHLEWSEPRSETNRHYKNNDSASKSIVKRSVVELFIVLRDNQYSLRKSKLLPTCLAGLCSAHWTWYSGVFADPTDRHPGTDLHQEQDQTSEYLGHPAYGSVHSTIRNG